jgi:hypothetical protein
MKSLRFFSAVTSCLLVTLAMSHAEDHSKGDRSFRVVRGPVAPLAKPSRANARNLTSATFGGPANKFKNAAAISGTGFKR